MGEVGGAYAQPTPRRLYVHDDLTGDVAREVGPASPAAATARELLALLARDRARVRVLTIAEQVDAVVAQGSHAPFEIAIGIGSAGQRVARTLHERVGWFPCIRRVGLTQPTGADDDQEGIAPGDRLLQDPAKIPTERNRIYIFEFIVWFKRTLEPIVDTIGKGLAVLAPVADEHLHFEALPLGPDYRYWTGERIHPLRWVRPAPVAGPALQVGERTMPVTASPQEPKNPVPATCRTAGPP